MTEIGSPEWFAELARRVAAVSLDVGPLVVEQHLVDARPGDVAIWHVVLGSVSGVGEGPASKPDITLTCDRATAAALADATINAQTAISAGRLEVGGDLRRLVDAAAALSALGVPVAPSQDRRGRSSLESST